MPRVKRGVIGAKRRRKMLSEAKGYRFGRSKKEREARTARLHAGVYAFAHRRDKKNDFRRLWITQIGAALRPLGWSYSRFVHSLKNANIALDRKILASFAEHQPEIFTQVIKEATATSGK